MNFTPMQIRTIVRAITKQTGTPLHDEDLEQEAALRAVEAFGRNRVVDHPRAFLTKIVRDTVRDHWRRRRPWEDIETIDQRLLSESPAYEELIDKGRKTQMLRRAMQLLCPRKRGLLQLFYEQDRSVLEIARDQNRTISAVKMDLLRTRQELARILGRISIAATQRASRQNRD